MYWGGATISLAQVKWKENEGAGVMKGLLTKTDLNRSADSLVRQGGKIAEVK